MSLGKSGTPGEPMGFIWPGGFTEVVNMLMLQDAMDVETESPESCGSERRRGLRIQQNRPIKVLDTIGGRYLRGQTRGISATGLQIELPVHATVRMGEMLNVHIGLNRTGEARWQTVGRWFP